MHSSRMRTARLLTASHSILCRGSAQPPPGCRPPPLGADPPGLRPRWMLTPLDADPLVM